MERGVSFTLPLTVDGGYAHNIPIEAATILGASRILIIRSSPITDVAIPSDNSFANLTIGKLFSNLQRLVPYFYNRSQVEDVQSAADILVATIAPTGRKDGSWPLLTDIQEKVVKDMFDESDEDISKRIGMIESWGTPLCRIGAVGSSCDTILDVELTQTGF
jgi:predicted patatin/cPLA2 family phospholipase